jgi:hypothetical protein
MNPSDDESASAPPLAEGRTVAESQRSRDTRVLGVLLRLETDHEGILADPASLDLLTRLGVEIGLDITDREAVRRRCAELRNGLGRA